MTPTDDSFGQEEFPPLVSLQPPVRLAPGAELARMVRETALVRALTGIAEWTGGSRQVTEHALPVADEISDAVTELGLLDAAQFERLWWIALDSDLVDIDEDELTAEIGPARALLDQGSDEDALEVWSDIAHALITVDADGTDLDPRLAVILQLFTHREAMRFDEPQDMLAHLEQAGLIKRSGPLASLTALGLWTGRRLFQDILGQHVPVFGSTAGANARTLLPALRSYNDRELAEEVALWLTGRDPEQAAQEIAEAVPEVSPLSRAVGLTILDERLGEPGRRALASLRKLPGVGALVLSRLIERGEERDVLPDPEDIAWVSVDMTVAAMEIGGPPEEILTTLSGDMTVDDVLSMIDMLDYSDHPHTELMLRFLKEHHPERRVVSAARAMLRDSDEPPGARGRRSKKPKKVGKSAGSRKKRRR
ncbi:hypothetical protein ACFLIM_33635 [Nonomuraea sp. M3C6]|uniref:DUF2336 domain-containing protein n=1 Tax=Nonomuraea marmarensis TaxID=3351344 RepID=A0ABW7AP20_9ACTN